MAPNNMHATFVAICLAAPIATLPFEASAGWEPVGTIKLDSLGVTGEHPELELVVATVGVPVPTKRQGLVWRDGAQWKINFSAREAAVGGTLLDGSWATERASQSSIGMEFSMPRLAMDPGTGRPYVLYVARQNSEAPGELWLSTRVGSGGNCGSGNAWRCENVSDICQLPEIDAGVPLLELGGDFGAVADTVHIVDLGPDFLHIRKDLENDEWECDPVWGQQGPYLSEPYRAASMVIRHEHDDRVKPQVTYLAHRDGDEQNPVQMFFRSLLNYVDTPLPPWAWTDEYAIGLTNAAVRWTFPALALVDDGLSAPTPVLTGYGRPAMAYLEQVAVVEGEDAVECTPPGRDLAWPLKYKLASTPSGSLWKRAEVIFEGRPCHPALAVGAEGIPYVAFANQRNGNVVLTIRERETGWQQPESISNSGTTPDLTYDHDDGLITVAFHETSGRDMVVVDGWWAR